MLFLSVLSITPVRQTTHCNDDSNDWWMNGVLKHGKIILNLITELIFVDLRSTVLFDNGFDKCIVTDLLRKINCVNLYIWTKS